MSRVRQLSRSYDDFRIDIPEMELIDNGVTALLGPSGSGKSSVLRILAGLDECPGLKWEFESLDLAALSARERRLGIVFQSYELFPHLTARENICFAGKARRRSQQDIEHDLIHWSKALNIEHVLDRQSHRLSGGEQQRVALARALMGKPRMLLLDEPFSALDADLRSSARELVSRVIQEARVPALLVTHDQEDVEALAQSILRIRGGRLVSNK